MVKKRSKFHPTADLDRIKRLIELLLKKPRSLEELKKLLGVSERTLFRDFDRLEEREIYVIHVGFRRPRKYQIWSG